MCIPLFFNCHKCEWCGEPNDEGERLCEKCKAELDDDAFWGQPEELEEEEE